MKSTNASSPARAENAEKKRRHENQVQAGAAGALAGAAVGAFAGVPGVIAGTVVGAVVGAITVLAVEQANAERTAKDRRLDRSIGVIGGDLGAPNLKHPPSRVGTYSTTSMGVGSPADRETPAEGPVSAPRE